MATKSINVPMEETLHRQFKTVAASVGLSEKDLLLRCFIFANTFATARVHAQVNGEDGDELDLQGILRVTVNGKRETRKLLRSIDSLATRLRKLESFTHGVSVSTPEDYVGLRHEARKLTRNGPWKDPKLTTSVATVVAAVVAAF